MEHKFLPKGKFNGRGRPRDGCPEYILNLLRESAERPDEMVVIDANGTTVGERQWVKVLIKRGAEELRMTVQVQATATEVRFCVERSTDVE